jgi:hypothetical protein
MDDHKLGLEPTARANLRGWWGRRKNVTAAGVVLAVLDNRNAFAPTGHIRVREKMSWVKLEDGLPQYPETVPL